MLTPIGVLGGVRGVFFFDIGGGWFDNPDFKFWTTASRDLRAADRLPCIDESGNLVGVYDPPVTVNGFRLADARASYGIGLETFVLGFPMHFDWSWRTMFNQDWEDAVFGTAAAAEWRKPRFQFWIGYDF